MCFIINDLRTLASLTSNLTSGATRHIVEEVTIGKFPSFLTFLNSLLERTILCYEERYSKYIRWFFEGSARKNLQYICQCCEF